MLLRFASVSLVWATALFLAAPPSPAPALTFQFEKRFDVAAFGASASGTPRGLAVFGSSLLVNDALDDQIFVVDPVSETATATYETDPFVCALASGSCVPTTEFARVGWDIAYDGTDVWLADNDGSNGNWLIHLESDGEYLARHTASAAGSDPGGLTFDPRGAGSLLLTDTGDDTATIYSLAGTPTGIFDLDPDDLGFVAPTGIAYFGGDTFFVSDSFYDTVFELSLPSGGSSTLLGETTFVGLDVGTEITSMQSVAYDASGETLYLLDDLTDEVFVFKLVPEPGTAALLAMGLAALAARRRRA